MVEVEYHKGPIGWAVIVDGKPVGRIRDQRGTASGGWYISIAGMEPKGVGNNEMHRRTLKAAKSAVENHFNNAPSNGGLTVTAHVDWKCLNLECGHEFGAPAMTQTECARTPWRWCPKCKASSTAVAVSVCEGYFQRETTTA